MKRIALLFCLVPGLAFAEPAAPSDEPAKTWSLTIYRYRLKSGGLTTLPQAMTREACVTASNNHLKLKQRYEELFIYCTNAETGEVLETKREK